jgi:5,5'-dehydrodivanillate O-demethylase
MLSKEANQRYTQVGPGTDMGELLRRYWMPIAGVSEFDGKDRIRAIRLMGEDLVLYRDKSGTFGLIDRKCPHRRADLSYGFTEECGLRCTYHGWLFNQDGACIGQPYEEIANPKARFKDKITIKSYPVQEKAGMVWAYMGPLPVPLLPDWEPFSWQNGFAQVVIAEVPCNWLQCQENSVDPVHFEWTHVNWSRRQIAEDSEHGPTHIQVAFEEFEHGFVYKRQREDLPLDHPMWTVGRVCLWPNGFFLGDHFEWRIPIDDQTTLSIAWMFTRVPQEAEPYVQQRIPAWRSDIKDPETGRWITTHVMNQDYIAWAGQGVIADRQNEHLGASDRGIVMFRQRLGTEMKAVAEGRDPKGLVRDPAQNVRIRLPIAERDVLERGMPLAEMRKHPMFGPLLDAFVWQAGQPEEVWKEFRSAMGLEESEVCTDVVALG